MLQVQVKRTVVDIDTRRTVVVLARSRKPADVAKENHETFIRNALKDKMGWPRREQAPEVIKEAAKQMAAFLIARDKALADERAAREAAVAEGQADAV